MTHVAPIWNSFNAGELSPFMDGRTDQDKYFAGCKTLLNMIPRVTGPASRRGGTRFVGKMKESQDPQYAVLVPFEFSAAQSYVLEFGDQYIRFWVNRGQLMDPMSPLDPYEIGSPFSANIATSQLRDSNRNPALRYVQSGDVMWLTSAQGLVAPQKLVRTDNGWTIAPSPFDNGPFDDIDPANTVTVQASGTTGVITLTASSPIFFSGMIGTSFYVEDLEPSDYVAWEPGKAVGAGAIRIYNGNVYSAGGAATTGSYPPVHLRGKGNDGGVDWTYLHSGRGWAKITAIGGGGTTATATVISRIPNKVVTTPTTRWARAAFSDFSGWPTAVSFGGRGLRQPPAV